MGSFFFALTHSAAKLCQAASWSGKASGVSIPNYKPSAALGASEAVMTQIFFKKSGFQAKEKLARGLLK
jgi:hypothetical protein